MGGSSTQPTDLKGNRPKKKELIERQRLRLIRIIRAYCRELNRGPNEHIYDLLQKRIKEYEASYQTDRFIYFIKLFAENLDKKYWTQAERTLKFMPDTLVEK